MDVAASRINCYIQQLEYVPTLSIQHLCLSTFKHFFYYNFFTQKSHVDESMFQFHIKSHVLYIHKVFKLFYLHFKLKYFKIYKKIHICVDIEVPKHWKHGIKKDKLYPETKEIIDLWLQVFKLSWKTIFDLLTFKNLYYIDYFFCITLIIHRSFNVILRNDFGYTRAFKKKNFKKRLK